MQRINLFQHANEISKSFTSILQEDKALDSAYSDNRAEIENKYRQKLAELDSRKTQRISAASSKNQSAQTNIQDALNALAEAEAKVPTKYKKKYRPTSLTPKLPDFQALDDLAVKINDGSFSGVIKRLTGIGGYSSMMDMVNDYLDHIEAGRMYLRGEQQKSSSYLAQEKAAADAEYAHEKAAADQKKSSLMSQNDQAYDQSGIALQNKLLAAIDDPALVQYDTDLADALEQLGAFD